MIQREPIYAALFNLVVSNVPELVTKSRELQHWNNVQLKAMPAFFLAQTAQVPAQMGDLPPRWTLSAMLYFYFARKGSLSPGEVANPIVDTVTGLFDPHPAAGPQTLGNLVQWARVGGTIETSEGTLGDKEVVQIPIHMLAV